MSREIEVREPRREWYHLLDVFTRVDEQLSNLARIMAVLNNNIASLLEVIGASRLPAVPEVRTTEVELRGPISTTYQPVVKISGRRVDITAGTTMKYEVSEVCDLIKIYVDSGKIQYDTREVTTDSDVVPSGSTLIWRIPRGKISKLYIKAVEDSTIYITEWKYEGV